MNLDLFAMPARFKSAVVHCIPKIGHLFSVLAAILFFINTAQAQNGSLFTVGGFLNKNEIRKFLETDDGRSAGIIENPPPSTHVGLIKVLPSALNSAEIEIDLPDGRRAVFITTTYPIVKDEHSGARRWEGRWKSEIVDGRPRQLANITLVSQYDEKKRVTNEYVGGGDLTAYGVDYEIVGVSKDFAAFFKRDNSRPRKQHPDNWKEFQEKKRNLEKKETSDARLDGTATAAPSTAALRALLKTGIS